MTEQTLEETAQPSPQGRSKTVKFMMKAVKVVLGFATFIGVSLMFAQLAQIHGKDIPEDYYVNGYPSILGLLNSEVFMGVIFVVTIAVLLYVVWLLWSLHEVAVHKAQAIASQQIQLVFALSLCGLFIHKAWWVIAIIIAFTRWDVIGHKISTIIANGRSGENK